MRRVGKRAARENFPCRPNELYDSDVVPPSATGGESGRRDRGKEEGMAGWGMEREARVAQG
jgi:hypothetical protein